MSDLGLPDPDAVDLRAAEALIAALDAGRVSRRGFLRRAALLGLSLSTASAALAACRRDQPDPVLLDPEHPLGPIERELAIYIWSDYLAPDTIPNFEKEFGCKVSLDFYDSNEEMLAKLQAGARGYDIVVPSSYIVEVLIALGLALPLHHRYLTNWGNLSPIFLDQSFDPKNRHTLPWFWGITGIAYRKDFVPDPPSSWEILRDSRYRGKMTQMDDGRDVIGSWLRYRGHSLNSIDPAQLEQARADAIYAKQNLKAYISAPVKGQLISGDVWVAQLWNGDAEQARFEQPNLGYVVPQEGCTLWLDSLVMPLGARHPRAAHEFMNYILRPEVHAAIAEATGYGTPNAAAMRVQENPIPFPTGAELARLEYQHDLGRETATWDQIWTEVKSA
ncbi:MAG TPA: spermidine/putrescine ABC transporter substrate-binding protein [Gemmatimonadales bacterium]|nr:spermidine/putrescine ABC transporter substrate-binding protein [Gemmatimonadales bacterium]